MIAIRIYVFLGWLRYDAWKSRRRTRRLARRIWGPGAPTAPADIVQRALAEGLLTPADIATANRIANHQLEGTPPCL